MAVCLVVGPTGGSSAWAGDEAKPQAEVSPIGDVSRFADAPSLEGIALVTGALVLMAYDESFNDFHQERRSALGDDIADGLRLFGAPPVYLGVSGGLLAAGLVSGDPGWRKAGLRVSASLLATSLVTRGLKYGLGRERPHADRGGYAFDPFTNRTSFPSGHTSMAFSLATSLSYEIDRPWATAGLYTLAAGTGWSRLNDNVHWLSDVLAGALIGHASSRLVRHFWGDDRSVAVLPAGDGLMVCWGGRF